MKPLRIAYLPIIAFLFSPACGQIPKSVVTEEHPLQDSACTAGQAQVGVYDGLFQRLCGCSEGPTAPQAWAISSVSCTVSVGTTVFFNYLATVNRHEILSVGTPSFMSSAISDPQKGVLEVRFHVVRFDQPGLYSFTDAFDNGLQGQIIVQ